VICAIILSLCDVDDHVIAHEYSLTEIGLRERRAEIIEHLINTEAMKGDTSGAERMISSRCVPSFLTDFLLWSLLIAISFSLTRRKEAMLGTLELIRQQYGSVYDYVRNECRVPEAAIERIRSNLVVQAAPDEEHPRLDQEAKHLL
jgi:protein tyrosine/serine phosphatase